MGLPGYEIHEVLGQGGFATVYRARQLAVGREVALKVDGRPLSTPRDQQRFMREVTAAGQLSGHPHVVPVYDAGVLPDNRPYSDEDGGGDSSSAAPPSAGATAEEDKGGESGLGVATTTENCAATSVEGVGGRCVSTPECWSGITDVSGIITVSRADCQAKHVWETFAIAPLPKDGQTNNARDLIKHPDVKALCSQKVMSESMAPEGREVADTWSVDIIPPSSAEWADGLRVFRCVAAARTEDGEKAGSQFAVRN